MRRFLLGGLALLWLCAVACASSGSREYEVRGQILAIDTAEGIVTIRHDDIKGFMPAMTMPFKVKDRRLLEGRRRGDLVKATLEVTGTDAYLTALDVVGHADLVSAAVAPDPVNVLQPGSSVHRTRASSMRTATRSNWPACAGRRSPSRSSTRVARCHSSAR